MPRSSGIISEMIPQICYHSNYGITTGGLSTLTKCYLGATLRHQYDIIVVKVTFMTSFGIGAWQTVNAMLLNFLMILQTEILSTETSDFLKQIIFLKSFN